MNRRLLGLLSAVAMAAAGTLVLLAYVHGAKAHALEGEQLVNVLVVDSPIAKGTASEAIGGDVHTERVPEKVQAEGAITDLENVAGLVTAVDLVPGEQLVRKRFVAQDVVQRSSDLPKGMLEVTISLSGARALGGKVVPGQTVGIVASEALKDAPSTHLVMHKVLVTGVQRTRTAASDESAKVRDRIVVDGSVLVTLAVDAPSAERIVFLAEHGTLWLTNEPKDANEGGTKIWTPEIALS